MILSLGTNRHRLLCYFRKTWQACTFLGLATGFAGRLAGHPGQLGATELLGGRQVQASQDRPSQDDGQRWDFKDEGEDNPVVTGSSGDPFFGAGDGIAKPAFAPNMKTAFVEQGVINDDFDDAGKGKGGEGEQCEAPKEISRVQAERSKKL